MTSTHNPADPADTADRALDAALRDLHREVLAEPVPPALMDSALRLSRLQQRTASARHWGGMAAGVVLAFSVGWLSHSQLGMGSDSSTGLAKVSVEHEFVRQAGFAYSVYMPEKRHPVLDPQLRRQLRLLERLVQRELSRSRRHPPRPDLRFEPLLAARNLVSTRSAYRHWTAGGIGATGSTS